MLALALAAAAVAAAVMAVVMMVLVVVVMMLVMMVMIVVVMMLTAGDVVVMDVHRRGLLCFFLILYPRSHGLSKHLFLPENPPGGLANRQETRYNVTILCERKEGASVSDHIHDHTHEHIHVHDHVHDQDHMYQHAHGIAHSHGHVHENQKAVVNRLARAIGHLEKVKRMVEEGYDCTDVLIQLAAVRSALDNTGKVILKDHMRHCMVDAVAAGDQDAIDDLCQAIDKFMK